MTKAKRPVTVGGIEFDALIDETLSLESTIPQYPVEKGYPVSDSIILSPESLSMTLYVTNTPVTWAKRHGHSMSRVDLVCKKLEELYFKGEPVTIITSSKTYRNMAIETLSITKSAEAGYAREIPITFKKIYVTSAKTTTIPDSYGKSGDTGAAAGTANTTTGSADGSSSSGAAGENGADGGTKSSILYGIANSMGLLG